MEDTAVRSIHLIAVICFWERWIICESPDWNTCKICVFVVSGAKHLKEVLIEVFMACCSCWIFFVIAQCKFCYMNFNTKISIEVDCILEKIDIIWIHTACLLSITANITLHAKTITKFFFFIDAGNEFSDCFAFRWKESIVIIIEEFDIWIYFVSSFSCILKCEFNIIWSYYIIEIIWSSTS